MIADTLFPIPAANCIGLVHTTARVDVVTFSDDERDILATFIARHTDHSN